MTKPKVYRFCTEPNFADDLAGGNIWISTLETCRRYEHPLQGDTEEATESYFTGNVSGSTGDRQFDYAVSQLGIRIDHGTNITFADNVRRTKMEDAFVICTTLEFDAELSDTFGKYCVEISDPVRFFKLISEPLRILHPIVQRARGAVTYRDRAYKGMQEKPGPIGFVKPADPYAPQKEFRMLWTVIPDYRIQPFKLSVPECAELCSRIL